jgi:EpsI family protein
MPGAGWFFRQSGSAQVPVRLDERNALPVKRAYMQKGDFKQLSYFWFPMRGRFLTSAFEMKLYNFWDALTRQRTDGALVRVITPIYSDEALEHAEVRLKQFVGDMVPVLNEFLPQ